MKIIKRKFSLISIIFIFVLIIIAISIYKLLLNQLQYEFIIKSSISSHIPDVNSVTPVDFSHKVWITSKNRKQIYSNLKHVINAFNNFDYKFVDFDMNENISEYQWDVLWAHNYPFSKLKTYFQNLRYIHCINHIPGTSFITSKVELAKSNLPHIPKAFIMPKEKDKLIKFSKMNPDLKFVQKSSNHRGIKVEKIENLDFSLDGTFIQQFIHDPLLVDGYKFDIGIYTVVTSISPLRVYISEEVLVRFCKEKYYPFFANVSKKYVIDDDYRPIWKIPSMRSFYVKQGFGMRETLNAWLKINNLDAESIWNQVKSSISDVFFSKEKLLSNYMNNYPRNLRFFELFRFDFIIDKNLKVYLMEANMSPNLNSAHFTENRLLYEQVVFNAISLVGIPYKYCSMQSTSSERKEMMVAFKDIAVFPELCNLQCNEKDSCSSGDCKLCKPCITVEIEKSLKKAYLEHIWRGSFRRIVPKTLNIKDANKSYHLNGASSNNILMSEWFRGKCLLDHSFCF